MTITLKNQKGAPLTYGELDENFRDLRFDTDLQRVLENGNVSNQSITVENITANVLNANTIVISGQSISELFTLPNNIVSNSVTANFVTANNIVTTNTLNFNSNSEIKLDSNTLITINNTSSNVVTIIYEENVLESIMFRTSEKTITQNVTISNTYNYLSIGPLEIANGIEVIVEENANWTIV